MNHRHLNKEIRTGVVKKLETEYRSKIGFSTSDGTLIIRVIDILYLEAMGNYTRVHLSNGQNITVSKTLKSIEILLPTSSFRRCHQSYIINLDEVIGFKNAILLSNNILIPVSRRKKSEIKSWFLGRVNFV